MFTQGTRTAVRMAVVCQALREVANDTLNLALQRDLGITFIGQHLLEDKITEFAATFDTVRVTQDEGVSAHVITTERVDSFLEDLKTAIESHTWGDMDASH